MGEMDWFEINNLNIHRRGNPPYPTSTTTSMPLPSTSSCLENNLNNIHVGIIPDLIASSSVPSTSRSFHTNTHSVTTSLNTNSNPEEQPPPSYEEAVLNRSEKE